MGRKEQKGCSVRSRAFEAWFLKENTLNPLSVTIIDGKKYTCSHHVAPAERSTETSSDGQSLSGH